MAEDDDDGIDGVIDDIGSEVDVGTEGADGFGFKVDVGTEGTEDVELEVCPEADD